MVFAGYSGFEDHLQLASRDLNIELSNDKINGIQS